MVGAFYLVTLGLSVWVLILTALDPGRWGGGALSKAVLWSLVPGLLAMAVPLGLSVLRTAWPERARWWLAGLSLGLPLVVIAALQSLS